MMKKIILLMTLLVLPFVAQAASRVALVIGNNDYRHAPVLENAVNDASAMAKELKARGFSVVYRQNASRREMNRAIDDFLGQVTSESISLIYYSGHGIQIKGSNYLIPVDLEARSGLKGQQDVANDAIELGYLLTRTAAMQSKFTLAVLDACRDNPFAGKGTKSIGATRGLAPPLSNASGTMVVYSAGANQKALDNLGDADTNPHGLFTRSFIKAMHEPGLSIQQMVFKVKQEVITQAKSVNYLQTPAIYDESVGTFYFTPKQGDQPSLPAGPSTVGGISFDQLAKEQANQQQWKTWQSNMQRDFSKAEAFADANVQIKAWDMFLSAYGEDNPLSQEDDRLRQTAQSRKQAAAIKLAQAQTTILPYTPPQPAGRVAGTEQVFDGITFVWIPPGEFMMGTPATEAKRYSDEQQHRVTIAQGFWLGKYEVTQAQWQAVMGSNPSEFKGSNRPVENVSWNDIQDYLQRLGNGYRLPTEAEWEYAARAGTITAYWWGNQASHEYANYGTDQCCGGLAKGKDRWEYTSPVGSFAANAWGLHDMHGNVLEWTSSLYKDPYDGSELKDSPISDKGSRSVRGGSWGAYAVGLRSGFRLNDTPSDRYDFMGVRLARAALREDR